MKKKSLVGWVYHNWNKKKKLSSFCLDGLDGFDIFPIERKKPKTGDYEKVRITIEEIK